MEIQNQELQSVSHAEKCQSFCVSRKLHHLGHRCVGLFHHQCYSVSLGLFISLSVCLFLFPPLLYLPLSHTFSLFITSSQVGHCNLNIVSWHLYTFYNCLTNDQKMNLCRPLSTVNVSIMTQNAHWGWGKWSQVCLIYSNTPPLMERNDKLLSPPLSPHLP